MYRRTLSLFAALAGVLSLAASKAPPARYLHVSSHLAEDAQVRIDRGKPFTAPGYGSAVVKVLGGQRSLKVTSGQGVNYTGVLTLKEADLMRYQGKAYWCVNLLETSLEPYSKDECQEDVTDAG